MESKYIKYRIYILILLASLLVSLALLFILILDNKKLEKQVQKRENLIEKTVIKEAQLSKQKTKNDSIIERFIDDCGIRINNKKVSSEDLLKLINEQVKEIESLKNKNAQIGDSLQVYESYVSLSKKNIDVKYSTKRKDNQLISTISLKQDSLNIYRKLYNMMQRDYGIAYKIEDNNDSRTYIKKYTKLDSALFVYKHYKHVLSVDDNGDLMIDLPTKREIRRSTSNQKKN
ncbi:cell division protein FtsB [Flavobacterium gossypii]|uniref:Cell division protein FtsB n=1 Tax=Flavobacterium gossypii TaxID=1646119 RepID=A0ABR6DSQ6_9FLAO|nr:hypothetical protein [Flavobacterium gossypii]MBA9074732.1 cell division protein FtsB [Flavobacterium gossypii]